MGEWYEGFSKLFHMDLAIYERYNQQNLCSKVLFDALAKKLNAVCFPFFSRNSMKLMSLFLGFPRPAFRFCAHKFRSSQVPLYIYQIAG